MEIFIFNLLSISQRKIKFQEPILRKSPNFLMENLWNLRATANQTKIKFWKNSEKTILMKVLQVWKMKKRWEVVSEVEEADRK